MVEDVAALALNARAATAATENNLSSWTSHLSMFHFMVSLHADSMDCVIQACILDTDAGALRYLSSSSQGADECTHT